mgnify:CR=1 FL=1
MSRRGRRYSPRELSEIVEAILKDKGKLGFVELHKELSNRIGTKPSYTTLKKSLDQRMIPALRSEIQHVKGFYRTLYYLDSIPQLAKAEAEKKRIVTKVLVFRKRRELLLQLARVARRDEELMNYLITDALVSILDSYDGIYVKSQGTLDVRGNAYGDASSSEAREGSFNYVAKEAYEQLKSEYGLELQQDRIKQILLELMKKKLVYFGDKRLFGFMYSRNFKDYLEKLNGKVTRRFAINLPSIHFVLNYDRESGQYEPPEEYQMEEEEREQEIVYED